ncbi:MAG: glycosyltransferase [Planctomycetes bacterium]|nr:glycosyltransferase [Planctomycetota bacterium]
MSRFLLVDQSIDRPGGHHYEYAVHMAREAVGRGWDVVVATHRAFDTGHWPSGAGTAVPLFPHTTYGPHTFDSVMTRESARSAGSPIQRGLRRMLDVVREPWRATDRARRLRIASLTWNRLLDRFPSRAGDHVFCATMSDFDLEGLVPVLATRIETRSAHWHLQFHFDVLSGRASDYPSQHARLTRIARRFAAMMARVPRHTISYHCTTRGMADQYNTMGVASFEELPYPVNPRLASSVSGRREGPLRITCAGYTRREKGKGQLHELIDALTADCLGTGAARLRVQGASRRLRRRLARWSKTERDCVAFEKHPMAEDEYLELIRSSDIGLFLYDSERYRHRCSGILVEMLMAGVPVIVPAGCWLGEQIAEPIQRHLQQQIAAFRSDDRSTEQSPGGFRSASIAWRVEGDRAEFRSDGGLVVRGASGSAVAEGSRESHTTDWMVACDWLPTTPPGSFLRIDAEFRAADGGVVHRTARILGPRLQPSDSVHAHFPWVAGARAVSLRIRNAFRDHPIFTRNWRSFALDTSRASGGGIPGGQVGIQVADPSGYADAVKDLIRHYDHYRATALAFAAEWRLEHHPRRALERLVGDTRRPMDRAA